MKTYRNPPFGGFSKANLIALVAALWLTVCVSVAVGQNPAPAGGDEFDVVSTTPVANGGYDVKLRNARTGYVHSVTIYIGIGVTPSFKPGDRVRPVPAAIPLAPFGINATNTAPNPGKPKSYKGAIVREPSEGIVTPSPALQKWANAPGQTWRDPMSNKIMPRTGPLQADHIVPKTVIETMPGFKTLTRDQKAAILNYPPNFQPLPGSLNASKGNSLAWPTYKGQQVNVDYFVWLRTQQGKLYEELHQQIDFFNAVNRSLGR